MLSIDKLETDEELRRAHLLLCLFAHAYVWGGTDPIAEIPAGDTAASLFFFCLLLL